MAKTAKKGNSVSAKFRDIYDENPDLLKETNNDKIYQLFTEKTGKPLNDSLKGIHNNLKSILRKKHGIKIDRAGKARRGGRRPAAGTAAAPSVVRKNSRGAFDRLEETISDALNTAKGMGREELATAIHHLRLAQAYVVLQTK